MRAGDCENLDLSAIVESLMLLHRDKWLRFVQRMVQNRADAEDVLQEAALKMLVRDRQFDSADQARMYLGRIICNTAIELYHLRKRNRRQYRSLQEHLPATSNPGNLALLWVQASEPHAHTQVLSLLNEGLARLPVKQYEALRLTVMNPGAVSIRDAGVEHDIPYSTLRHRKVQGLRHLRRFLLRALRAVSMKLVMA